MTMGELIEALEEVEEFDEILSKSPDTLTQEDLRRMLGAMITMKCFITSLDIGCD